MNEDNQSYGKKGVLTHEPEFSPDFAQRVMLVARKQARRRRLRKRMVTIAGVLLLVSVIPFARLIGTRGASIVDYATRPQSSAITSHPGWQVQWNDDDLTAYELAKTTAPRSAGDYLLPNAAALAELTSAYSEASRQSDYR
jgi:hypothetical protein